MATGEVTTALAQAPPIPANTCAQMVEAAARSCQPMISMAPEPANTTADSLAALSTAFTYGSMLLAVVVLLAGYAWAKFVAHEAGEMAKTDARNYIDKWLAEEAPGIIRERVDLINDATLGSGNDDTAADDLGAQAG
jgi:hypothetical protein